MDALHLSARYRLRGSGPPRSPSTTSIGGMKPTEPQRLRVLVAANGEKDVAQAEALVVRLSRNKKIDVRCVADSITPRMRQEIIAYPNNAFKSRTLFEDYDAAVAIEREQINFFQKTAYDLCEWSDLLVLVPIDANTLARMLHGMTDDLLLEVLRGWDVGKKILLVPGMTTSMWENPLTKKQLNKIRRKWNWIRIMQPILWSYDEKLGPSKLLIEWEGFSELEAAIKNQAELITIGHDVDIAATRSASALGESIATDIILPPEIWAMILEYAGDWEVSAALGIWTNLAMPPEWKRRSLAAATTTTTTTTQDELHAYMRDLEWTILTSPTRVVIRKLSAAPASLRWLSSLCVKLIIKFGLTELLGHLESGLRDVFWASFGPKLLPTKASAAFGRVEVLEWWRTSPSFLSKDYTAEAVDGASKSGFVHVLDWWRRSGLPMKYTEAALEQASVQGHILVLEWWKKAAAAAATTTTTIVTGSGSCQLLAASDGSRYNDHLSASLSTSSLSSPSSSFSSAPALWQPLPLGSCSGGGGGGSAAAQRRPAMPPPPLQLKVGKSIVYAAQHGQADAVRWWDASGVPYSHGEAVARTASAYGHVGVLEAWRELKGDKMSYDAQVLVHPTKNGHAAVLEWWIRQSRVGGAGAVTSAAGSDSSASIVVGGGGAGGAGGGPLRVEYRPCDIDEALEDCVGGQREEDEVRKWWARNGFNRGVPTSEWMKVKIL